MLELITKEEKEMINYYRKQYGYAPVVRYIDSPVDVGEYLSEWEANKPTLFKLLSNQLIYSKRIKINSSNGEVKRKIDDMTDSDFPLFWIEGKSWMIDYCANHIDSTYWYDVRALFFTSTLSNRLYEGADIEFSPSLKIKRGMKMIKIYKKLNDTYNIVSDEEFEKFRIWHSMLFNTTKIEGDLCFSIHPLDYMTMSDNYENWTSCMSWVDDGCYRRGTVEMMTSENILVVYLKSDSNILPIGVNQWNSKRYRILAYIDEDIITNIKAYPYEHCELNKLIVETIKELAEKNLGWKYDNDIRETQENFFEVEEEPRVSIEFTSDSMYNDFGRGVTHYYFNGAGHKLITGNRRMISKDFSGPPICAYCGSSNFSYNGEDARELVCDDCMDFEYCDCCGGRIYPSDEIYTVQGDSVCYYCFENAVYCPYNDEYYYEDNVEYIYLAKKDPETGAVIPSDFWTPIPTYDRDEILEDFFGSSETIEDYFIGYGTIQCVLIDDLCPGKRLENLFELSTNWPNFKSFFPDFAQKVDF